MLELLEAVEAVHARALAAVEGAGEKDVGADLAALLLVGVAADPVEVMDVIRDAALRTFEVLAGREHDPVAVIRGALLETFVLGGLVGPESGVG